MTDPNEIVGHKTFRDEQGGFRHEPLTRSEAAVRVLTDAVHRLEELGWRNARYCPKDGSEFELIEAGSSGIHRGLWSYHNGRDGAGCVWIPEHGDMYPSHPILYRPLSTPDHDGQK